MRNSRTLGIWLWTTSWCYVTKVLWSGRIIGWHSVYNKFDTRLVNFEWSKLEGWNTRNTASDGFYRVLIVRISWRSWIESCKGNGESNRIKCWIICLISVRCYISWCLDIWLDAELRLRIWRLVNFSIWIHPNESHRVYWVDYIS